MAQPKPGHREHHPAWEHSEAGLYSPSAQAPGQACGPTEGQGRGGSGDVPGLSEPWSLHREKVLTEAETGASGTQDKEQRVAATQKLERLHMEHSPAGTFISGTENTRE